MSGGSGDGLSASSSGARQVNFRVVPPPDKNGVEKHRTLQKVAQGRRQGELSRVPGLPKLLTRYEVLSFEVPRRVIELSVSRAPC